MRRRKSDVHLMSSAETHVLWAKSTAQLGIRGPDPHYVLKTEDKEWRKEYENDFERTEFEIGRAHV